MGIDKEKRLIPKSGAKTSSNTPENGFYTSEIGLNTPEKGLDLPETLLNMLECDQLTDEMRQTLGEYALSLHGICEDSKDAYVRLLRLFALFITQRSIRRFEDATARDVDLFVSNYQKDSTKNNFIIRLKHFYGKFLKRPELVEHLKLINNDLEPVTPSELLTPNEIVALANEGAKKREMYKVIILVLFESCARINEVLNLRLGDVIFGSVTDKEGHRKLIATLYFKRSKGGVNKQPLVLTMFSSELKRWCDNHPCKGNTQAWLFPSPFVPTEPVDQSTVHLTLWDAGERLGITKKLNPHWLRHSGLSYFANAYNYNEQLLMWRAGWKNTVMAQRYIHSGAELEGKAYLERMGYVVNEEKPIVIKPKTCPHCNALNPFTNANCDMCAMPLDLGDYKKEIQKRRTMETYFNNLRKIGEGNLSEEYKNEIKKHVDIIEDLPSEHSKVYLEKLLEAWVKAFLTT